MHNRFRVLTIVAVAVTAALVLALLTVAGQQQTAYRAPRTKDGKPSLYGIWQSINSANWDIEAHSAAAGPPALGVLGAIPPGVGIVEGGTIPYKPEALAKKKENFEKRWTEDPEARCYLPGIPRFVYMPFPFQIIQSTDQIVMVSEYKQALRTIYMTNHKPAPADSWMGWSNGRWDGETLVVETTGFNDRSWFDRAGNYHSDALKVVERFTATSPDHLSYEATIEDPQTYTKPWKVSMPLYRRMEKNLQVLDFRCVEYAEELIYGHLRKQPTK